jgi:hypothetical protein
MVSALFFSQLVLIALVWLCLMLHWVWRMRSVVKLEEKWRLGYVK